MEFEAKEISMIVEQVIKNLDLSKLSAKNNTFVSDKGDYGVFENVDDAIIKKAENRNSYQFRYQLVF